MKEYVLGIEATIEIFGGKWKTLIVYILMLGTKRTSELQRLIPKISQKVLIEQLRELEKDGIIQRISYEQMPPKVEYSLTEYGKTFSDILYSMCYWGRENIKLRSEKGEDILRNLSFCYSCLPCCDDTFKARLNIKATYLSIHFCKDTLL